MIKAILYSDSTLKSKYLLLFLSLTLIVGLAGTACEGPTGSEGPIGPEGSEGPVGPAGEDGSMMYADEGKPDAETGDIGDYYLDQLTGELYGPKDEDSWGKPGIVLMGENGSDGKDGSQIYSGEGEPDEDLGEGGDYYLNRVNYDLYGPKTGSGWGSPLNLKGADGNANVTRYIFSGHDFTSASDVRLTIEGFDHMDEMFESAWLVYLVEVQASYYYDHIPGEANGGTYKVRHFWDYSDAVGFRIDLTDGPGFEYNSIEVVRIGATNTENLSKVAEGKSIIPDDLDVSDYEAITRHYEFKK